ncbi:hypothetical protein BZG36_04660 [Bifiguratus adelaidae]|uniref:C2H2-type domain-containing protein n=1 Tax=Bifiguratus adelaidae TaxID=1938954 RepID=A0A261Y0H3_9FUNG|nr:hypothetical protein BZG36_04660 [Bifiguratus adelaidae]
MAQRKRRRLGHHRSDHPVHIPTLVDSPDSSSEDESTLTRSTARSSPTLTTISSTSSTRRKHDHPFPYQCPYPGCDKAYKKPCKRAEHERVHTGERPFVCPAPGCTKAYRRSTHLQVHAKTHDAETAKPFQCTRDGCTAKFSTRQHLVRHEKLHEQPKPYKCTWEGCEKAFSKNHQLRKHMCEHTNKKPYPCDHPGCDQSFDVPTKLRKHQQHHSDDIRYQCGEAECTAAFTKWSELQEHVRENHQTHTCEICQRPFKKRAYLTRHLKTHQKDRPEFECWWEGCDKSFSSNKSLNVHVRASHEGIRPFCCDFEQCGKAFAHKHLLIRHKRLHERTDEEIEQAQKRKYKKENTSNVSTLHQLVGSHYGEDGSKRDKPCPHAGCPFVFTRQWDVDRHVLKYHLSHSAPDPLEAENIDDEGTHNVFRDIRRKALNYQPSSQLDHTAQVPILYDASEPTDVVMGDLQDHLNDPNFVEFYTYLDMHGDQ